MSQHLDQTKWDKVSLVAAINERVDRDPQKFSQGYLFPEDISDQSLDHFQVLWESNVMNPVAREAEFIKLYQAVVGGF